MSRHVMECLGMSRVTIEDGRVVDVTEPKVRFCPLFAKRRGMEELNRDSIRENIEYRIRSFGMCTEDRVTTMDNFLNFGISETLCSALRNDRIDAAVIAADGCGTAIITDPTVVQGMGGRISGICETEPIETVIRTIGRENMLDSDTAAIDMEAGADKAFAMGFKRVAVTTPSVDSAVRMRKKHGDGLIIICVHTTNMLEEDARKAFDTFDIITACASKHLREECLKRSNTLVAGNKIPVYAITPIGKELVGDKLRECGKKPWRPGEPTQYPDPLI